MTIGIRYLPKEVWADSESFCVVKDMENGLMDCFRYVRG